MKIGIVQLNYTIADVSVNVEKTLEAIKKLDADGAELIVCTEMLTTGYPPKDLLHREDLIERNLAAKTAIVGFTGTIKAAVAFGYVAKNPVAGGKHLFNAACIAQGGKIVKEREKVLLPTYDVFAEDRYFEPGKINPMRGQFEPVEINGVKVGLLICEEIWNKKIDLYPVDPVAETVKAGAEYIVVVNASPYRIGVKEERHNLVIEHVKTHRVGLVYVNQTGYNDSVGFDGNSFAVNPKGEIIFHAPMFQEHLEVFDTKALPIPAIAWDAEWQDEVNCALTLGINDYFDKNGITGPAIVCNSGGIDSALVLYYAVRARGAANVISIAMPSEFSSDHSLTDAAKLAKTLQVQQHIEIPIAVVHEAMRQATDQCWDRLFGDDKNYEIYGQRFAKTRESGTTDENLQARIRGAIGMALANRFNGLVLSTSNKSEAALGYTTLYGDMCGGLAVIIDLLKTEIYDLANWINETYASEIIPKNTIIKKPSAELRPGQFDQQSLPPYSLVDAVLRQLVNSHDTPAAIYKALITEQKSVEYFAQEGRELSADIDKIIKLTIAAEHKRVQSPVGLKVSKKLFKSGWDMPIAHKLRL